MFPIRIVTVAALSLLSGLPALASSANHLVADYGTLALPFTHSVGDAFSGSQGSGFTSQDGSHVVFASVGGKSYFYDDFVFTLPNSPQANFDAAAVSIDMSSFLSLGNFSARLYKLDAGMSSLTTGLPSSGTPIQAWTSTALLAPGVTGTTVLFQNVDLQAGASYALEFRGTIDGAFGGSYGGNLNISPVPEPGSRSIALAALTVVGLIGRRRLTV